MNYTPHTATDMEQMLRAIGVEDMEALLTSIPSSLRATSLNMSDGLTELELKARLEQLSAANRPAGQVDLYRGAGLYRHDVPAVVDAIASRGEFATAYTPYQAEASQGTLQSIYEFQTMICELTGLDVANASLYDGASSLAEAATMALRITGRNRLVVSRGVHPEYRRTLQTYLAGLSTETVLLGTPEGVTDLSRGLGIVDDRTAALMVQMPNFLGCLEPVHELAELARSNGALFVVCVTEPVSLGLLEAPGNYGADIVVGEAQSLGSPLSYGGPSLGFFATNQHWIRKIPGRVVGRTMDQQQRSGYVLTLQAREQHIRREKATSNICTNQGLVALRATVFLSALGPRGLQELALLNFHNAHALHDGLMQLPYIRPRFGHPFFNEFVVELTQPRWQSAIEHALAEAGIVGGLPLEPFDPLFRGHELWCATETTTAHSIDRLIEVLRHVRG